MTWTKRETWHRKDARVYHVLEPEGWWCEAFDGSAFVEDGPFDTAEAAMIAADAMPAGGRDFRWAGDEAAARYRAARDGGGSGQDD